MRVIKTQSRHGLKKYYISAATHAFIPFISNFVPITAGIFLIPKALRWYFMTTYGMGEETFSAFLGSLTGGGLNAAFFVLTEPEIARPIVFALTIFLLVIAMFSAFIAGPCDVVIKRWYYQTAKIESTYNAFLEGGIKGLHDKKKGEPGNQESKKQKNPLEKLSSKQYFRCVKILFFRNISVLLWTCLFIIPGIIRAYQYAPIPYMLGGAMDNDDVRRENERAKALEKKEETYNGVQTWQEARNAARKIMKGRCKRLFLQDLSFVIWIVLGIATAGIVLVLVTNPYIIFAHTYYICNIDIKDKDGVAQVKRGGNAAEIKNAAKIDENKHTKETKTYMAYIGCWKLQCAVNGNVNLSSEVVCPKGFTIDFINDEDAIVTMNGEIMHASWIIQENGDIRVESLSENGKTFMLQEEGNSKEKTNRESVTMSMRENGVDFKFGKEK